MDDVTNARGSAPPAKLREIFQVVTASAAGTAFEWYDFFIFGAMTPIITKRFFSGVDETTGFILALLVFGVGFGVRPLGALVFGHLGDRLGRKGAFLVTISIMGAATVAIGLLPTFETVGVWAPVGLIALRILQGFALGGEYGGAAIYVAEHAAPGKRGLLTAWIQSSASIGLTVALLVILATRKVTGEDAFAEWGWRIPFLASAVLLAISLWIRLSLEESPVFRKLQAEGAVCKAPLMESFAKWDNLKVVLLTLGAITAAQGAIWYTAHFYAQFFLERVLKVDGQTVNTLFILAVSLTAPFYVLFGWLSDKIGRKPIIMGGIVAAGLTFFPGFQLMTQAANPALAQAARTAPVTVIADPATCAVQFDPVGKARFLSACDIAKSMLAGSGISYANEAAPKGSATQVRIGATVLDVTDAFAPTRAQSDQLRAGVQDTLKAALQAAGYPDAADPAEVNGPLILAILSWFIICATALYGPQAAALVELFPTRIRYTALSLPYNIGTGWFGGFLPATAFAIVAASGNIYAGIGFPVAVAALSILIGLFFLPETRNRDISL